MVVMVVGAHRYRAGTLAEVARTLGHLWDGATLH